MSEPVSPTRADPVARSLSEVVGGPRGEHARPHRWWTPVRVLLVLTAVVLGLAIARQQPCVATHWSNDQARYAKMCYSDLPYLYTGRGLSEGTWPYADDGGRYDALEYPVGISYFTWTVARLIQLHPAGPSLAERRATEPEQQMSLPGMAQESDDYFLLSAVLLAGAGLLATWFLAATRRRRPWDALPFALSPALFLSAYVNWDLLAVALVAAALWAWSRGRALLTGVLVGLGAATKLYPLFLLGGVLVICVRERRWRQLALSAGGAAGAWVVAQLPALVTGPGRWEVFWRYNADRAADLGSLWLVLAHHGTHVSPHAINQWSWVLFGSVCVAVALLGLRVRRTPRLAQLGFLIVAGFLVVNKVYSPQYVLWLLPLAVLARPRWRDLLLWQAGEVVYFGCVWLYLGGWLEGSQGAQVPVYDVAISLRVVAELYLVGVIVRDVVRGQLPEGLADDDVVERGRGEAHPDVDLVPHLGHR